MRVLAISITVQEENKEEIIDLKKHFLPRDIRFVELS